MMIQEQENQEIEEQVVTPAEPAEPAESEASKQPQRRSVRENLRDGFEAARKRAGTAEEAREKDQKTGRYVAAKAKEPEPSAAIGGEEPAADKSAATEATPPSAWAKEAKDAWAQTPSSVQAAVLKREADTQKGVDALKASYSELDQALAPHVDAIRQHGHTPAQAVSQLFAWFQALASNPDVAFPALMKSFNYQLKQPAAAHTAQETEQQPPGDVEPSVQQYINDLRAEIAGLKQEMGNQINGLASNFAAQSQARTEEVVSSWAKDKPHFEAVRGLMAQLISSGAVPLKDGHVDLDGAYNMAIYAMPDVRQQLMTEEQKKRDAEAKAKRDAEAKAASEAAAKAKAKQISVITSAPGAEVAKKQNTKGKSVRESLMDAIEDARNG
jgi:hypothetical protein